MPRYRESIPHGAQRVVKRRRTDPRPPVETGGDLAARLQAAMAARSAEPVTVDEALDQAEALVGGEGVVHVTPEVLGEAIDEQRIEVAGDTLVSDALEVRLEQDPDPDADELTVPAELVPAEATIGDHVVVTGPPDADGNVLGQLAHVAGFGSDGPDATVTLRWGVADGGLDEPQEPQEGPAPVEGSPEPGDATEAGSDEQGPQDVDTSAWLSATEAAEVLAVDPAEVRRRCREGELEAVKDAGGAWRIDPAGLSS